MKSLLLLPSLLLLSSCAVYHEREGSGGQVLASVMVIGTDAEALRVNSPTGGGIDALGVNQSDGLQHVGRTITGVASITALRDVQLAAEQTTRHVATEQTTRHVATEATSQAAIGATADVAGTVGNNPEANATALGALKGLFGK